MTLRLLIEHHLEFLSLKGGYTGSSDNTPVKMPQCWIYHVMTQISCLWFCFIVGIRELYAHFFDYSFTCNITAFILYE